MTQFKHTVTLKEIPKHIFDTKYPTVEIAEWLFKHIGDGNLLDQTGGVWDKEILEYSEDGQNIILKFNFLNPADATLFSLKWA